MLVGFISYVSWIWARYGVLKSISQSYYELPQNLQPLFTFFCWGFALPAIIVGSTGWMFLAGAGIGFVGAAAAFQEDMTHDVHMVGAGVGVGASQLAIFLNFGLWPINIAFISIGLLLLLFRKKIKTWMWWTEIAAFISICVALGIKVI
jgi:hypothetical protein